MTAEYLIKDNRHKKFHLNQIYNKKDGTVLNRTPKSWGKLIAFYTVFYAALACIFAISMWVFFQTLDPRIPRLQLQYSAIGVNPGLGFRPMPLDNAESTLIHLEGSNETQYMPWVNNLMTFLDEYYKPGSTEKGSKSLDKCTYDDIPDYHHSYQYENTGYPDGYHTYYEPEKRREKLCGVNVREWGPCTQKTFFTYDLGQPCIFIKLNKIFGWEPIYHDVNNLPKEMPRQLKEHIYAINRTNPKMLKTVWVSCSGENPADIEYLGELEYYPQIQGFPGYYFPYTRAEGYLSPVVAVRVKQATQGVVMNIECKAWAQNIKHSRRDKTGLVHFELLLH